MKQKTCTPNATVIYKIKKYKYNYRRERYQFSWSRRMVSFEECQEYIRIFESATEKFDAIMGYCSRKQDIIKIEIKTPNPFIPLQQVVA